MKKTNNNQENASKVNSALNTVLVCANTNCRFNRDGDCEFMTDPAECDQRFMMEVIESPWHKDFKDSTTAKRVMWDVQNKTH